MDFVNEKLARDKQANKQTVFQEDAVNGDWPYWREIMHEIEAKNS